MASEPEKETSDTVTITSEGQNVDRAEAERFSESIRLYAAKCSEYGTYYANLDFAHLSQIFNDCTVRFEDAANFIERIVKSGYLDDKKNL